MERSRELQELERELEKLIYGGPEVRLREASALAASMQRTHSPDPWELVEPISVKLSYVLAAERAYEESLSRMTIGASLAEEIKQFSPPQNAVATTPSTYLGFAMQLAREASNKGLSPDEVLDGLATKVRFRDEFLSPEAVKQAMGKMVKELDLSPDETQAVVESFRRAARG